MSRFGSIGGRLYRGDVSIEFVGRRKLWFAVSGLILAICIVAVFTRGLNYSVEFKGGSVFQFRAPAVTQTQVSNTVAAAGGGNDVIVESIGGLGSKPSWEVQTGRLTQPQTQKIQNAITSQLHPTGAVSSTFIGPTWGGQISKKAVEALIAFLIAVVIYLSIAFEWKMASSALIALAHDIVITIGVYALAGFEVSPATVIGLLTILGYSLYDTVVVFDKVRENTAGLLGTRRSTYSQAANLALNQTLVRSINTSLIALLPVSAILVVGVGVLGAGELKDLALVLFVGMLSGTYSSIFIATPSLATMKEREPAYRELAKRVAMRAAGGRAAQRARAKAGRVGAAGRRQGVPGGPGEPGEPDGSGEPDGPGDIDEPGAALADGRSRQPGAGEAGPAGGGPAAAGPDEPDGIDERVPAARPAASSGQPHRPAGGQGRPRQQPRRGGSARRRPGGKKRRR